MLGSHLSGLRGPARPDWEGALARVFSVGVAEFLGGACVGGACGRLAASVVACLIFAGPGLLGPFGGVGGGLVGCVQS